MDLNNYKDFVKEVTSDESNNKDALMKRMNELDNVNISLLLTGGIGLSSEGGEFNEIVKKVLFQGKPWNDIQTVSLIYSFQKTEKRETFSARPRR